MMKTLRNFTALGVGAGLLTLVTASPALATISGPQALESVKAFGHAMRMSMFYDSTRVPIGEFSGTILCLETGRQFVAAPVGQCVKEDHVYALSMGPSMVHPLLAEDQQTLKELPRLVGKKVVVDGKYYESIGMILAGKIRSRM